MFSFKPTGNSVAIARVEGGVLDGVRVYLVDSGAHNLTSDSMVCNCGEMFDNRSKMRAHQSTTTKYRSIDQLIYPCPYRTALRKSFERGELLDQPFDDYVLPDGEFKVLPYECSDSEGRPSYNQRIYIAGASGCGKSRWAGQWLRDYQLSYPDRKVTAFCHTSIEDDPAYEGVDTIQFDPNDQEIQELSGQQVLVGGILDGTICLFDDIDELEGDAKITVRRLLGQTVMMGRKAGIPVVFCNHRPANNHETNKMLNSATSIVMFPRGGSPRQLQYLAVNHGGMTNGSFRAMLDSKPKWAYLHRDYPNYVISDKRVTTLDKLEFTTPKLKPRQRMEYMTKEPSAIHNTNDN